MIVLGLTGSIGMGKSNAAMALRRLGIPVHDADAAVHRLLGPGGQAVRAVAALFPDSLRDNRIDRKRLGDLVFGDTRALRRLESILHPLVRRSSRAFLAAALRDRRPVVVLDIPLLFESRSEGSVDAVIVVSAPAEIQRQRVLARAGMTEGKFLAIRARQVPDSEKRRRADFVVRSGGTRGDTFRQLRRILNQVRNKQKGGWRGSRSPARGSAPKAPRHGG
jgi:dephospho-CoA kinase